MIDRFCGHRIKNYDARRYVCQTGESHDGYVWISLVRLRERLLFITSSQRKDNDASSLISHSPKHWMLMISSNSKMTHAGFSTKEVFSKVPCTELWQILTGGTQGIAFKPIRGPDTQLDSLWWSGPQVPWRKDTCIPKLRCTIYKMKELNSVIYMVTVAFSLPFLFSQSSRVNKLDWLYLPPICPHNLFFYFSSWHSEHLGVPWGQILYPVIPCISVSSNQFWYIIDAQWILTNEGINWVTSIQQQKQQQQQQQKTTVCFFQLFQNNVRYHLSSPSIMSSIRKTKLFTHSSKDYKLIHLILIRTVMPQKLLRAYFMPSIFIGLFHLTFTTIMGWSYLYSVNAETWTLSSLFTCPKSHSWAKIWKQRVWF